MKKDNIRYYLLSMVGLLVMCGCSESEMDYDYIPALKEYYLSIAPNSHSVPSAGSTSNFSIKAGSNHWEISNPAFWLELDNNSGIGSSTIGFKTSDNLSSDTARVCILTVDSEDGNWHRSIPVTISQQKASPYINIGAYEQTISGKACSAKISVDANMAWTASSDVNWATVVASKDGKYIDVDFTENTGISRKATITIKGNISKSITIVQQSANITTSLQSLSFGQSGGTQTVQVNAEASWEARTSANWLGLNPSTGHVGETNLYITATANNSLNDRTDFVYVCIGNNYKEIRVDQPGIYLNISATSLSFVASGESQSVSVSSNTSWDVVSCPDWISLNTKSGTDNAELILTAQSNESVNSREGKITIENSVKNISRTITLSQPGKTFDIGTQELTFSDKAGSQSIEIQTDLQWTASTGAEWITLNPSSGKGKSKLQISVTENTDTLDRIGYVNVYAGGKTLSIAVVQESKYIHISSEAFHFNASTGNATLSISTNYNWTAEVEDGVNWLIVMPKSGSSDAIITIGVSENNTPSNRTAKLFIAAQDAKTYIIEVTQNGRYLTADHSEINFSKNGGTETINISTDVEFSISKIGTWFGYTRQDNTIKILATENTSGADRTGSITLTMTGIKSGHYELVIPVTQSYNNSVNLGLSVNWGNCNIGAVTPEEYGNYYAWGEITPKNYYLWDNYKWYQDNLITKYCADKTQGVNDKVFQLKMEDDAAYCELGDGWRMPTYEEFDELLKNCTWQWKKINGISGYRITATNGNSIFLPAAGIFNEAQDRKGTGGSYWTNTLVESDSKYAYGVNFYENKIYLNQYDRSCGRCIRPVYTK